MTPRTTPTRAWGKRQWVRLVLCVVGLGAFVGCTVAVVLPQIHPYSTRHGFSGRIAGLLGGPQVFLHSTHDMEMRYVHRTESGFVDITDLPKPEPASRLDASAAGAKDVWTVSLSGVWRTTGYWAPASRLNRVTLLASLYHHELRANAEGPISAEAAAEIRRIALAASSGYLSRYFPTCDAQALALRGKLEWSDPIWSGYLLNTATILGLGMFLWCAPLTIRDVLRWRRFRREGKCKACGYDLRGLPTAAPLCPECGVERTALPSPRATPDS